MTLYKSKAIRYGEHYRLQRQFDSHKDCFSVAIHAAKGNKLLDCQPEESEEMAFRNAQKAVSSFEKVRRG